MGASAGSQLVPHSSGRLLWIGKIVPVNPTGNPPCTPLVIGEFDAKSGRLQRDAVRVIDERNDVDSSLPARANSSAREDRETGEIVVNLRRRCERSPPERARDWTSHASLSRVRVM